MQPKAKKLLEDKKDAEDRAEEANSIVLPGQVSVYTATEGDEAMSRRSEETNEDSENEELDPPSIPTLAEAAAELEHEALIDLRCITCLAIDDAACLCSACDSLVCTDCLYDHDLTCVAAHAAPGHRFLEEEANMVSITIEPKRILTEAEEERMKKSKNQL